MNQCLICFFHQNLFFKINVIGLLFFSKNIKKSPTDSHLDQDVA